MFLEICADSVESAVAAERGGADRIELCSALVIGGLSPSPELFRAVRRRVGIPVRVMVRPRFGDFLYTPAEREVMLAEAASWASLGADGIVFGALDAEGRLDAGFLSEMIRVTPAMRHTLHRAFDLVADPFAALEAAVGLGFDTILTSGQASSCLGGAALLKELRGRAAGRVTILGGAGVSAEAVPRLVAEAGLTDFHASAKTVVQSGMAFRREGVPMGLPGFSEFEIWRTDEARVRALRSALDEAGA